jgi:hypothetical protein
MSYVDDDAAVVLETPTHATEVVVAAATAAECVLIFMEMLVDLKGEYPTVETRTVLQPAATVAIPWQTAKGLRDALDTTIRKYEDAVAAVQNHKERPN